MACLSVILALPLLILAQTKAAASQPVSVRNSGALRAALLDEDVAEIFLSGKIALSPLNWTTVIVTRDLLVFGTEGANATIDFGGLQEAVVLEAPANVEWRSIVLQGAPEAESVVFGTYSQYRTTLALMWPSIVLLDGAEETYNRTWLKTPSIYPVPAFAKIFGTNPAFQQLGSDTFLLHGALTFAGNLTNLLISGSVVGNVTITSIDALVTRVNASSTAAATSPAGSEDRQLLFGWQTALVAVAIAVGILFCVGVAAVVFRSPLRRRWRHYRRQDEDVCLSNPKDHISDHGAL